MDSTVLFVTWCLKFPPHLYGIVGVLVRAMALELVTRLLPRRPGFDSRPVHVAFVVGKVTLRQGFISLLLLSPTTAILPLLRAHLNNALTSRTSGRSLGTFKHSLLCQISGSTGLKSTFTVRVPAQIWSDDLQSTSQSQALALSPACLVAFFGPCSCMNQQNRSKVLPIIH
jgi:hypothetical protein